MQVITREDTETIKIIVNEFLMINGAESKENIPIEFLKYLRKSDKKIEDGVLFNELSDLIESKLANKGLHSK
jgi:hypothetical protein